MFYPENYTSDLPSRHSSGSPCSKVIQLFRLQMYMHQESCKTVFVSEPAGYFMVTHLAKSPAASDPSDPEDCAYTSALHRNTFIQQAHSRIQRSTCIAYTIDTSNSDSTVVDHICILHLKICLTGRPLPGSYSAGMQSDVRKSLTYNSVVSQGINMPAGLPESLGQAPPPASMCRQYVILDNTPVLHTARMPYRITSSGHTPQYPHQR